MKHFLLVEDEEYALEDLKDSILAFDPTLKVSTALNATEATEALASEHFDAIFLDIELPGMNGIEFLQTVKGPIPPVVLVTAHALHALDAFGLGVVECLLKPVDTERLRKTVERIGSQEYRADAAARMEPPEHFDSEGHVVLREGSKVWLVKVGTISRFVAHNGTTTVFFPHGSSLVRRPLSDLESRLNPRFFFRINSIEIVNLDAIDRITSSPAGHLIAYFSDGLELAFSGERSRVFEKEHAL